VVPELSEVTEMGKAYKPLQVAIFSKLTSDSNLMSLVQSRVLNQGAQNTPYPLLEIERMSTSPMLTRESTGTIEYVTVYISAWDAAESWDLLDQISARVCTLLDKQVLTQDNYKFEIRLEFSEQLQGSSGDLRHISMRFRVLAADDPL
jgi:hypothetical protein